jgi:hypothetical protein
MDRSLFFHIWQFSLPTLAFFSSVFRNAIHCALYVTMWLIFRLTLLFLSRLSDLFLSFVYSGRRCYYGPELQWHASWLASCQVNTCFPCMFWNTVITMHSSYPLLGLGCAGWAHQRRQSVPVHLVRCHTESASCLKLASRAAILGNKPLVVALETASSRISNCPWRECYPFGYLG